MQLRRGVFKLNLLIAFHSRNIFLPAAKPGLRQIAVAAGHAKKVLACQ